MSKQEYATRISLYDSIIISDLIGQPFELYGANINMDSYWTPIDYTDTKNYDVVIERSIIKSRRDTFIIIKLQDEMREDLQWKADN